MAQKMDGKVKTPIAQTALWVAAERARESEKPDALFKDPFARKLAGEEGFEMIKKMEMSNPNAKYRVIIRTKFIDDLLMKSCKDIVNIQIVNIACGCDCRPYRLAIPNTTKFFELDFLEVIIWKKELLKEEKPSCILNSISTDLSNINWVKDLIREGFDPNLPSFWIVEGLLGYLKDEEQNKLLGSISSISAKDSQVVGTMISETCMQSEETSAQRQKMAEHGSPFQFGTNHPESFWANHGWKIEVVLHDQIKEGTARLPEEKHISKKYPISKYGFAHVFHYMFHGYKL